MIKHRILNIRIPILIMMSLLASLAQAAITSVSAVNSPSQLSIVTNGFSQISWSVVEYSPNGGVLTISSPSGLFRAPNGSVLGTVAQGLQTTVNVPPSLSTTYLFSESLSIPQSVIRQAQKEGFGRFNYVRQFSDGQSTVTATASFTITGGGAAGELLVRRVEMEYDDGRISAVLAPRSEIRARAVVSYNGTGLLEYSWEVAGPPSTQGEPIFVPLVSRRQYLLAGDQVVLQTPRLPTDQSGDYRVRLRIDNPAPGFKLPVLRYAINRSGKARSETRIMPLQVARPAPNATLTADTLFAWQPVVAAKAYQLELYTRPVQDTDLPGDTHQPPVTGVLVPAEKTQLMVGSLSRAHMLSGNTYFWRVVALSDQGRVIARSDFRRIQFQ